MGAMDYFKKIFTPKAAKAAERQQWYQNQAPIFRAFGRDVYLSDCVGNAIDRCATAVSKIDVRSIVRTPTEHRLQNDDITRLFRSHPNPLQTTSDFLASVEWLRRKNRNAWIYPTFEPVRTASGQETRRYTGFYPLDPLSVRIGEANGVPWEVELSFGAGLVFTLPYADLLHMKWRRGKNLVLGGGGDRGEVDDRDTLRAVEAYDKLVQGLPKAIESSMQINGVYHAKTLADTEALKKARDDFESHFFDSRSGIVATDVAGEFTPVNIKIAEVPEENMAFLRAVLHEKYGVSAAILSGDYTPAQNGAFYETVIEDFAVQFQQEATAKLFTQREQDLGHQVRCYFSTVEFLSESGKLELAKLASETGILDGNGIANIFGIEPYPGGERRTQSLNFVNIDLVDSYQLSGKEGQGNGEG